MSETNQTSAPTPEKTKREKTPLLKCLVVGNERLTNRKYLEQKATEAGISVADYLGLYISRPALKLLRAGKTLAETRAALEVTTSEPISDELLQKAIKVNGKHKKD